MTENWLIAGIALLALLCGFGTDRFRMRRRLADERDQAYDDGWRDRWHREDNRARANLAAGYVLRAGGRGRPVWVKEANDVLRAVDQPQRPASLVGAAPIGSESGGGARSDHRLPESGDHQEDAAAGELASDLPGEPAIIPNLGAFVAGEATHVSERTDEPLRSTGGFIPELAPWCTGTSSTHRQGDDLKCGLCLPDETPAPVNPPAGAGTGPRPGSTVVEPVAGTGPGPDPLFADWSDDEFFKFARWELDHHLSVASEPFTLTGWEAA